MKKRCKRCQRLRNFEAFPTNKISKDGYDWWCRDCRSKYYFERKYAVDLEGIRVSKVRTAVITARGHAKRLGVLSTLTFEEWMQALKDSKGICFHCGKVFTINDLQMDHLIPLSKGGCNIKENVVPSCAFCNQSKNRHKVRLPNEESTKDYTVTLHLKETEIEMLRSLNERPSVAVYILVKEEMVRRANVGV